jgi:phosphohistidine swiveling domain-containing protein
VATRSVSWVIPLDRVAAQSEPSVGGKAARLARMARAGFRVPPGFCLPATAYERFVKAAGLAAVVRLELGRKPLEAMRWEEMWDAALRIRSAFLAAPVPSALAKAIVGAVEAMGPGVPLAVRSSAPGEDSATGAFAGIHESVVGVIGGSGVLDAVKMVWASLWSDAALLYRRELGLDPSRSRMAVLVQTMVTEDRSGVAFGRDPRAPARDHAIVEAVPGLCADLVDGRVDPDRWILERSSGTVVEWRRGVRGAGDPEEPLLAASDLTAVHQALGKVEALFGWPPDVEWTGRASRLTLLQSRPITTVASPDPGDKRAWYLTLRPGPRRLRDLKDRVAGQLIPALEAEGERFAAEDLARLGDAALAGAIETRAAALEHWRQVYEEAFIPFAHGVRHLGQYYNDAVRPRDAYEFVGLLQGQPMLASERNRALADLAALVQRHPALRRVLAGPGNASETLRSARTADGGEEFVRAFEAFAARFLDVSYKGQRLRDRADTVLAMTLELADAGSRRPTGMSKDQAASASAALEGRLLHAVGDSRRDEAREVIEIGRLSWRLRDDDNLLLGRIESQLLSALQLGADRLRAQGRLAGEAVGEGESGVLIEALRNPERRLTLPKLPVAAISHAPLAEGEAARQLIGQPAAPGLATGRVRRIRTVDDLGRFRAGEVLVCDAIQPTMTHLVPLASAVVERRGGMLIHGAIVARELGIPCVNGIADAADVLGDGDLVTVDGHLGIVTVGEPEFDLERMGPRGTRVRADGTPGEFTSLS